MYAIVDIETTGGYAANHRITEIAIHYHDGMQVTDTYHTLINPGRSIPYYITGRAHALSARGSSTRLHCSKTG